MDGTIFKVPSPNFRLLPALVSRKGAVRSFSSSASLSMQARSMLDFKRSSDAGKATSCAASCFYRPDIICFCLFQYFHHRFQVSGFFKTFDNDILLALGRHASWSRRSFAEVRGKLVGFSDHCHNRLGSSAYPLQIVLLTQSFSTS